MERALQLVTEGLSSRQAADVAGVHYSSVQRRVNGTVPVNAKAGAPTLLSAEEEGALLTLIMALANRGLAFTKTEIRRMATRIASDGRGVRFGEAGISKRWMDGFR